MVCARNWNWNGTLRTIIITIVMLVGGLTFRCQAAPPRILEDEPSSVRPAAFAQPDEIEPAHLISPRTKSESPSPKSGSPAKKKSSSTDSIWGTVIGLAAVLGLFFAGRVWLTRHGPAGFRGLPTEALELLGKRTIEPRVSIHVVRCGPKILVLGVSPDGVRTLTEISDPVEIDLMAGACRRKDAGSTAANFAGLFRQTESTAKRSALGEA